MLSFKCELDDQPFSATGAREALAQVGKDCERRGWQYGNDHERQLVWMYTEYPDEPPALVFGKPATGWLLANVTCDQGRKSLIIKSTVLPDRPKTGQIMPLTIRVADQDYSASGQVEMLDGGDVPGFLVANFDQPRPLLDKLRDAQQLTMSAKSRRMQISARGIGPLLPRFEKACGLSQ